MPIAPGNPEVPGS